MQICDFDDSVTTLGKFTDIAAADPAHDWNAMVLQGPGFADVLVSGNDPTAAASFVASDPTDLGLSGITPSVLDGVAGVTTNTFIDPSDPALASALTFTIPFMDPIVSVWDYFLPLGF
jgi:hypothetical protein